MEMGHSGEGYDRMKWMTLLFTAHCVCGFSVSDGALQESPKAASSGSKLFSIAFSISAQKRK